MRQQQMNWTRLLEPEDTCSSWSHRTPSPRSTKNLHKLFSVVKCLLWFGVAVLIGLFLAGLH